MLNDIDSDDFDEADWQIKYYDLLRQISIR